jgi:hypothetical protein
MSPGKPCDAAKFDISPRKTESSSLDSALASAVVADADFHFAL